MNVVEKAINDLRQGKFVVIQDGHKRERMKLI